MFFENARYWLNQYWEKEAMFLHRPLSLKDYEKFATKIIFCLFLMKFNLVLVAQGNGMLYFTPTSFLLFLQVCIPTLRCSTRHPCHGEGNCKWYFFVLESLISYTFLYPGLPLSGLIAREELHSKWKPGSHGGCFSTTNTKL